MTDMQPNQAVDAAEPTLVDMARLLIRHWRIVLASGIVAAVLAASLLRPQPPRVEVIASVEVGRIIAGDQPIIVTPPSVLLPLVNDVMLNEMLDARRRAGQFDERPAVRMPDGGSVLTLIFNVPAAQAAAAEAFAVELRMRICESLNGRILAQKQEFADAIAFLEGQRQERQTGIEALKQRLTALDALASAPAASGSDPLALQGLIIAEMRRDYLSRSLSDSREALIALTRELRLLRYQDSALRLSAAVGQPVQSQQSGGRSLGSSVAFGLVCGLLAAIGAAFGVEYLRRLREPADRVSA